MQTQKQISNSTGCNDQTMKQSIRDKLFRVEMHIPLKTLNKSVNHLPTKKWRENLLFNVNNESHYRIYQHKLIRKKNVILTV